MNTFIPKNYKFQKQQKGNLINRVTKVKTLTDLIDIGTVKLIALEQGRISPNHLLCCFQFLNKRVKKIGQINIKVFPHTPITGKPLEVRMGKGKGNVEKHVSNVFFGTTLFEIEGNNLDSFKKLLKQIQIKLPIKTRIIYDV